MATVLLVEDDPAIRQGLELALRRLGYGVRPAGTGEAALRDARDASVLLVLSAAPRQVFSREQLLGAVWEQDYLGDSRLVDACVQRLRAKIEADAPEPRHIQTVRGFGYRFGPV
jgi:two-component system response regulator MtrA